MPDLAAIMRHAARSGAKAIITGDHAQLGAVQAAGGMAMLARKLGHAQLTEAVRFRNDWEGTASLGIRAGDVSALGVDDGHGRLHGGSYEDMAEQAVRAYLADYLAYQVVTRLPPLSLATGPVTSQKSQPGETGTIQARDMWHSLPGTGRSSQGL